MSQDPANVDPTGEQASLDEQLVAYLDGELDDETSRRIGDLLVSDPKIRETLKQFEQTWEMLGNIDRADVDEIFTQSTLEMVAAVAADEAEKQRADAPRRRRKQVLIGSVSLLAAGVVGFLGVWLSRPNPNTKLLADLPVLERLDQYRQIENVQFLEMLAKQDLFGSVGDREPLEDSLPVAGSTSDRRATEVSQAGPAPSPAVLSPRVRIQSMSGLEKESLRQRQEAFQALDPDEQQALHDLHAEIQQHEQSDVLYEVMYDYHDWIKNLGPGRRYEIRQMPPSKRIEEIADSRSKETAWQQGRKKLAGLISKYIENLIDNPQLREQFEQSEPGSAARGEVLWTAWTQWRRENPEGPIPAPADLKQIVDVLRSLMPPHMRPGPGPPEGQLGLRTIDGLVFWHFRPRFSDASREQELAKYLQNEMTPAERDSLMNLPLENMREDLLRRYFSWKFPDMRISQFGRPDWRHEGSFSQRGGPSNRPGPGFGSRGMGGIGRPRPERGGPGSPNERPGEPFEGGPNGGPNGHRRGPGPPSNVQPAIPDDG